MYVLIHVRVLICIKSFFSPFETYDWGGFRLLQELATDHLKHKNSIFDFDKRQKKDKPRADTLGTRLLQQSKIYLIFPHL